MTTIEVLADAASVARAGALQFVKRASEAIAAHGQFGVALAGGSIPRAMYELLAGEELVHQIPWSRVHVFFGDERCVPPRHSDSTYSMVRTALLDRAPLPPGNVHRMRGEDPPDLAALAYESELRAFFSRPAVPQFDLVLLGMGEDGHAASIFPGLAVVHEQTRWVVACCPGEGGTRRLTLTPAVINAASAVTFLVAGHRRATTLKRVLDGPYKPDLLPAQIIRPRHGSLRWIVDEAAAADLERVPAR
jgi:6-phosphogluconolactonase